MHIARLRMVGIYGSSGKRGGTVKRSQRDNFFHVYLVCSSKFRGGRLRRTVPTPKRQAPTLVSLVIVPVAAVAFEQLVDGGLLWNYSEQ